MAAIFRRAAGATAPSDGDVMAFSELAAECAAVHRVALYDCLVMAGHRWWSLRERVGWERTA